MGSGFDKAQELNLANEPNARSHEMENLITVAMQDWTSL